MSRESAVAAGRLAAEAGMLSRCAVMRATGGSTTVDGVEVPAWETIHADLPMQLAGADRGGSGTRRVTIGETEVQLAVRVAKFPAATANLRDGDLVDVTAGENAGVVIKIVEASWQDQATARRVPVVEWDRPEEWD